MSLYPAISWFVLSTMEELRDEIVALLLNLCSSVDLSLYFQVLERTKAYEG